MSLGEYFDKTLCKPTRSTTFLSVFLAFLLSYDVDKLLTKAEYDNYSQQRTGERKQWKMLNFSCYWSFTETFSRRRSPRRRKEGLVEI